MRSVELTGRDIEPRRRSRVRRWVTTPHGDRRAARATDGRLTLASIVGAVAIERGCTTTWATAEQLVVGQVLGRVGVRGQGRERVERGYSNSGTVNCTIASACRSQSSTG